MRSPAATTAAASAAIVSLTGSSVRASALTRESSLPVSKRVKRRCHSSSRSRAWAAAAQAPAPATRTSQVPPKQPKR